MKVYNVLLEGKEDQDNGYFVTIEVAANSKVKAKELALAEASRRKLQHVRIEEIEFKELDENLPNASILKIYGKSYFSL
jgi:hypothetical protein